MIILELITIFISIFLISISVAGYGSLINLKIENNYFIDIFLGFIIIAFLISTIHFFLKINFLVSSVIFTLGIIIYFKKKKLIYLNLIEKKFFYLCVIFLLLPMLISQKYHEDFGYYHLPYAIALIEEKIVFGFANIDRPFVYNSIWLNLKPLFFLNNKNFNFLSVPSFLLFLSFILFLMNKIITKKKVNFSDYYLVVTLFYFLLKFTRVAEFGVDLPAIIFSILAIYYFIKFYESDQNFEKEELFYLNLIFSVFSILIKLSTIPIILLTIYLYIKNFRILKLRIFNYKFLIIYLLCLIFFTQQFIYTGCILFPTNFTCLDVSWFSTDHLKLSKQLELTNKSYSVAKDLYSPEEYLSNFNWFIFWLKRNLIEIIEHLMTITLPILVFVFFLKNEKKNYLKFKNQFILSLFVFFSLIFWLNFSPVFRFANHIFITLIFVIFVNILASRKFSIKKFMILISIFLIFNFSKNILRIKDEEKIFFGIKKMENEFLLNEESSNEYEKIYYPNIKKNVKNGWQGRLCWDIPFICSYNQLQIKKKNGYLIINKLVN